VVRLRRANPGGKAAPAHPVVPAAPLKAPSFLDAGGRSMFLKKAKELLAAGLYSPADDLALGLAIQHCRVAGAAAKLILEEGPVVKDPGHQGRLSRNPASDAFRLHSVSFLDYAKQFGMVPVARLRTTMAVEEPDPSDDLLFDT
jgi:P27 family predicted phage terminase small subunit